jgi:Tol biopolymer transport system component
MSVNDAPDVNLDRLLTDWLEADAAPRAPEILETAFVEGVASTRQRPAWATTERWISMETRAQLGVMPRAVIFLLTIVLLGAALAASLALAGAFTRADDGGDPLAGLTYNTSEGVIYQHPTGGSGDPVPLTGDDAFAALPFWSPDGTRFAYLSWSDGDFDVPPALMTRDADGSNPVVLSDSFDLASGPIAPPYLAWSPDGSRILYSADGLDVVDEEVGCRDPGTFCGQRIWSVASDGSEPARVIGDPALDARSPLWTPDGESIIFAASAAGSGIDYGIYRMDTDGAMVERIGDLTGDGYSLARPAISPDGTTLAVSSGQNDASAIYLVDLATGEDVLIPSEDEDEDQFGPFWSPDGSLIAFTSFDLQSSLAVEETMLYDVASGETISLGESLWVEGWSADSRFIVSRFDDGILTVVDVTDPTAPVATEVEGVTDGDWPSWQPRP